MAASKRGIFENPTKSPYNFEKFDSRLEERMMRRLEKDAEVAKWQKRHTITIDWIDPNGKRRKYRPDFLVEYTDGRKEIVEVKGANMMDSPSVLRKEASAQEWCRKRGMEYRIATIH